MFRWFLKLEAEHKVFSNKRVADLGPQGLSHSGGPGVSLRDRFPPGSKGSDLYELLGCAEYRAYDLFDQRAEKCDFNDPPRGDGSFDVVTNFGTSEHVFNQAAVMRFAHELMKPGGVFLCTLPSAGGRDHGFFNYQPSFFWNLARANDYQILTFDYFPFYAQQNKVPDEVASVDLLTSTRWKGLRSFTDEGAVKKASLRLFLKPKILLMNLRIVWKCIRYPQHGFGPFFDEYKTGDYVHVALRKLHDKPFIMPIQGMYLNSGQRTEG